VPEDRGLRGDGRPRAHRFRSYDLELGRRLRAFRAEHGLTQAEVARVVGAGGESAVCQWERGFAVPDGPRRARLVALLDGRLWPEFRRAMIAEAGMPTRWRRAARWYRRASRERQAREAVGAAAAAILGRLRAVDSADALRDAYWRGDAASPGKARAEPVRGSEQRHDGVRAEDAAYGLRWVELASGLRFDLSRSLVRQVPSALLAGAEDAILVSLGRSRGL
jgi:transcriptional regulator with XRE-family HTH domain